MFWTPIFVSLVTFCLKFCLRSRFVTAATFGPASGAGSTKFMQALFLRGQFLKARIVPERIEHRIEPEQRRSEWAPRVRVSARRYRE